MTAKARKGTALVIATAGFGVLMALSALVADIARMTERRTRLQAAADASALAAAFELQSGTSVAGQSVQAIAEEWATRNEIGEAIIDAQLETRANGQMAVVVTLSEPLVMLFAGLFGPPARSLSVAASAGLASIGTIPAGVVPFGLPAYQDAQGQWWALATATPATYVPLNTNQSPELLFKASAQGGNAGNFLALALDGAGSSTYRNTIINGSARSLEIGSVVNTETGNMVGPTIQGVQSRMARGADAWEVLVPLISRTQWEQNHGRKQVSVIGFIAATLSRVTPTGEVYATFHSRIMSQCPRGTANASPGVFTPVLLAPES